MSGTDTGVRRRDGFGLGTVIAMVAISVVVAVPAGMAWAAIFIGDKGAQLVHWWGRKCGKDWAQ